MAQVVFVSDLAVVASRIEVKWSLEYLYRTCDVSGGHNTGNARNCICSCFCVIAIQLGFFSICN